jgi:hypothetical protein
MSLIRFAGARVDKDLIVLKRSTIDLRHQEGGYRLEPDRVGRPSDSGDAAASACSIIAPNLASSKTRIA